MDISTTAPNREKQRVIDELLRLSEDQKITHSERCDAASSLGLNIATIHRYLSGDCPRLHTGKAIVAKIKDLRLKATYRS